MNINLIIELKKEFGCQVKNILIPLIYEGLIYIYNQAKNTSNEILILKLFQSLLSNIKDWSEITIKKELTRIYFKTKQYPWFIQLIQSFFKINQIVLGIDVDETTINELNIGTFIHYIYIECAREFWMDPFLFYHDYSSLEIKRNYSKIIEKIDNAIDNAMRRLLPMGIILEKFLGDKANNTKQLDINELYNIPLLLDIKLDTRFSNVDIPQQVVPQQVEQNSIPQQVIPQQVVPQQVVDKEPVQQNTNNKYEANLSSDIKDKLIRELKKNTDAEIRGGGGLTTDINNKILNIINDNNVKLSDSNDNIIKQFVQLSKEDKHKSRKMSTEKKSSDTLKKIIKESVQNTHNSITNSMGIDSKVKNQLLKNLDSESESIINNMGENYQDIFSNSEIKRDTVNNNSDNKNKTREKFFNNYLNI